MISEFVATTDIFSETCRHADANLTFMMVTNAGKMKVNRHCEQQPVPSLLKVKCKNAVPSVIW